jgi:hypothetical protein
MVALMDARPSVAFEGMGEGTEIWGGTQANFIIERPGHPAKEAAVILNDPGAAHLASLLGYDDTPEFRAAATRHLGQALLERAVATNGRIESLRMLGRADLDRDPALVDAVRVALAARASNHHDGPAAHGDDGHH